MSFKRKGSLVKLYEVQFNGSSRNFDRVSAKNKEEAKKKMKEFYPNDRITKITLVG